MKKSLTLFLLAMLTIQAQSQIIKDTPKIASQLPTCSLSGPELEERNNLMKENVSPLIEEVVALDLGYAFHFKFDITTLEQLSSFIALEKKCCSFISYNIILPANEDTIAVEVMGSSAEDKELIRNCWQIK